MAPAEPHKLKDALQGLFGLAVVVIALQLFGIVNIPGLKSALYSPSAAAVHEARQAVEGKLTSPGSAKFKVSKVAARTKDEKFFVVYVIVDSQNNFGAVMRSHGLALVMVGESVDDAREVLHLEVTKESPPIYRFKELTREIGSDWELEEWMKS